MVLMRHEIGDVLRDLRLQKGMTLRQVAGKASVALGYLSEIERGQKEASSEVLASIADALNEPLSLILIEVGERLSVFEELTPVLSVPDTLPDEFYRDLDAHLAKRS